MVEVVVFSACGEVRTSRTMPVLTAYFPVLSQGILGKVAPPLEDRLPYGANGLVYPTGTGCTDLQLIGSCVADCHALTLHGGEVATCNKSDFVGNCSTFSRGI